MKKLEMEPAEKSNATVSAFCGELEVEDGSFILSAERFVIRENAISFKLSGTDQYGDFEVEGIAKLLNNGIYSSEVAQVNYRGYSDKDKAVIYFNKISPSGKKMRCKVEGKWVQGDTWPFSGNLHRFKN